MALNDRYRHYCCTGEYACFFVELLNTKFHNIEANSLPNSFFGTLLANEPPSNGVTAAIAAVLGTY